MESKIISHIKNVIIPLSVCSDIIIPNFAS